MKLQKLFLFIIVSSFVLLSACNKEEDEDPQPVQPNSVTDINGNVYPTVKIGNQIWMKENLKVTKLNDGTAIPEVINNTTWAQTNSPGYCWYENDKPTYGNTYGAFYNWYTVETGKLCPTGWHVPTEAEWDTLIAFAGGAATGGKALKEVGNTHWSCEMHNGTNSTGFTALPSGRRHYLSGSFDFVGQTTSFWTVTSINESNAFGKTIYCETHDVPGYNANKHEGMPVRCLKD
jgi:uncharacterized protein (TIGR02145 family)